MNPSLHLSKPYPPSLTPLHLLDASHLISRGSTCSLVGRVRDWRLGWAGQIQCTLVLSMGELKLQANRDTLPLNIGNGSWIRAKLMRRHDVSDTIHVVGAVTAMPEPGDTSWVPEALYHRYGAMRDLRHILSTLEPVLQGVFMSTMLDRQAQRAFFWRPAASDHHCYPGGLFDQSIAAAKTAHRAQFAEEHDRGLATLGCLLFDIGKAFDNRLTADGRRIPCKLTPHPATLTRLGRVLDRVAEVAPGVVDELREVLSPEANKTSATPLRGASFARIAAQRAVKESWGSVDAYTFINPGEAA